MPSKKKIKSAARRVRNTRRTTVNKKSNKRASVWKKIWNYICWPFRQIAKFCKWLWDWVCGLNVIGMVNTALLVSIIVLFTMLILDFTTCKQTPIVVVAEPVPVTQPLTEPEKSEPVLPIQTTTEIQPEPVNVVPVQKSEIIIAKRQIAVQENKNFMGDVIINSRGAGSLIQNNSQIDGDLYIQNMNKYTLPCDVKINGNLFLRDIGLLQFCGDFVVTGNIYVSPRSSFGPIPKTARVGGYVVL